MTRVGLAFNTRRDHGTDVKLRPCLKCDTPFRTTKEVRICQKCSHPGNFTKYVDDANRKPEKLYGDMGIWERAAVCPF